MEIYQEIWDADMDGNGVQPVVSTETINHSDGYVWVDTKRSQLIFKEVYIPDRKLGSYQLVEKLFDNYSLNQNNQERVSPSESKEIKEFLVMVIDSAPGQLAKGFVEKQFNKQFNQKEWFTHLYDLWFKPFNYDSGRDLSGFEHVFIGEQKERNLVGHHFWYKFWLEESARYKDQVERVSLDHDDQPTTSDFISINYHLHAFDYKKRRLVELHKRKCAFFLGLSAEGLLAMGTVRAAFSETDSVDFIINNIKYKLRLYMSPDRKSIRTLYPVYVRS
ncbi:hypothetical protein [Bacillus sp. AK128]